MLTLKFKQVQRDAKGIKYIYVLDYLDMKFSIAEHRDVQAVKVFAAFKQDDGSYIRLEDFKLTDKWDLRRLINRTPSTTDMVNSAINDVAIYIGLLYGHKQIETQIEEAFNILIEQWINE